MGAILPTGAGTGFGREVDYPELAFPRAQFDPEPVVDATVEVSLGETDRCRNVIPIDMVDQIRY